MWVWPFFPSFRWLKQGSIVYVQAIGCLMKMPIYLRVLYPSSTGPCASTIWNMYFHFLLFQMLLITLTPNCLMVAPLYGIRVVPAESNFSKVLTAESKIAVHNHLRTEISIAFATTPVSVSHLTSTLGPVLLIFGFWYYVYQSTMSNLSSAVTNSLILMHPLALIKCMGKTKQFLDVWMVWT